MVLSAMHTCTLVLLCTCALAYIHVCVCAPPPQELVNLLLCGVAAFNVFNGQMELDLGGAREVWV